MKKIITAIGDEELNSVLKLQSNIVVESSDIQYQEGIIEALEKYTDTDTVILKEDIIGDLSIEDLIRSIIILKNDIEIILIGERKSELEEIKNITRIVDNKENYVEIVLKTLVNNIYIKQENVNNIKMMKMEKEEITQQVREEKIRIQSKNGIDSIKVKIKNLLKKKEKKKEVISVIGSTGIGKTTFIAILSKICKSKRILIIDFDFINNNLYSVFGVSKYPKEIKEKIKDEEFLNEFRLKERNIKNLIVKVEKGIDLIPSTNIVFDENYMYSREGIKEMIEELKRQYEIIIIDTLQDTKYAKVTKTILELSTKIVCLVGGNLLEIKKTIHLLNNNQKDKVNIVYNKKNKYAMKRKILEILLFRFKIIGCLHYDSRYDQIINKNVNKLYITKKIKKEYNKILNKLQIN